MSTQIWAELYERAFRRLAGTVRVIVFDNLKERAPTPDVYDPALNPLYRDVLAHYGIVAFADGLRLRLAAWCADTTRPHSRRLFGLNRS